jgi:hypothetical protein
LIERRIWEIKYNNWLASSAWDIVDYPRMFAKCPGVAPREVPPEEMGYPGEPPEVFAPPLAESKP